LRGTRVSPSTVSNLNKKIYGLIEVWRHQPIEGEHPYLYLDGIVIKRVEPARLAVGGDLGQRRGLPADPRHRRGAKEDKASWSGFLSHLKQRGLQGVELTISHACMGLVESIAELYPEARWQRCMVHFYHNVFSPVPAGKLREVALPKKAIHAQEDLEAARHKASEVSLGSAA
jgi:putative transposase